MNGTIIPLDAVCGSRCLRRHLQGGRFDEAMDANRMLRHKLDRIWLLSYFRYITLCATNYLEQGPSFVLTVLQDKHFCTIGVDLTINITLSLAKLDNGQFPCWSLSTLPF
jgi:hypothetical protein